MIIVTARLVFETQEHRDRAVVTSTEPQAKTRDEEAGCLMYCFAPDPAVPTEIQVYELCRRPARVNQSAIRRRRPRYRIRRKPKTAHSGLAGLTRNHNSIAAARGLRRWP